MSGEGFFAKIQGKFKQAMAGSSQDRPADFQVRYLGLLIDTVARRHRDQRD